MFFLIFRSITKFCAWNNIDPVVDAEAWPICLFHLQNAIDDHAIEGYYVDKDENMARIAYIKAERMLENDQGYFIPCTGKVYLRLGDMYFEGVGTAIDYDRAYECYQRAERGFYEMIRLGDLYSDGALKHVTERQTEIREILDKDLPVIDWAEKH